MLIDCAIIILLYYIAMGIGANRLCYIIIGLAIKYSYNMGS